MDDVRLRRGILLLILLVGVGLRFHALDRESYYGDEIFTFQQTNSPTLPSMLRRLDESGLKQAPYYALVHLIGRVTDFEPIWIRRLSALAGTAAIPASYWLGSLLAGSGTGLVAAAILAIAPIAIIYSREARVYSIVLFLILLAAGFFWQFVSVAGTREQKRRWLAIYSALSFLAVALHPYAIVVVGTQVLLLVFLTQERRVAFVAAALVLGTFPVLRALLFFPGLNWIATPTGLDVLEFVPWLFHGIWFLIPPLLGNDTTSHRPPKIYLLVWFLLPVTGTYLFSLWVKPVWCYRYLLVCLPPLVLLVAMGMVRWLPPRLLPWTLGGLLLGGVWNLSVRLDYYTIHRPKIEEAVRYLHGKPRVAVAIDESPAWNATTPMPHSLKWYLKNYGGGHRRLVKDFELTPEKIHALAKNGIRNLWWFGPPNTPIPDHGNRLKVLESKLYGNFNLYLFALNP